MKATHLFLKTVLLSSFLLIACQEEIDLDDKQKSETTQDNTNPDTPLDKNSIASVKKLMLDSNIQISYPIGVVTYYKDAQQSGNESFDNNTDFLSFLNNLNDNILTTIKYPVTIYDRYQNEITIKNNQNLKDNADNLVVKTPEQTTNDRLQNEQLSVSFDKIIEYITQYDGRFDDFIDGMPNYSIAFPYTVTVGNQIIKLTSKADYPKVKTAQKTDNDPVVIVFPINLKSYIFELPVGDKTNQIRVGLGVKDVAILDDSFARFTCLKIQYPIFVVEENTEDKKIKITSDLSLQRFTKKDSFYYGLHNNIVYPINLIDENQNTISVNSAKELISALNRCKV